MSIIATPAARPEPTRPHAKARRVGWVIMTLFAVAVGGYAVALVASGFRLVPVEIAANRFPTPLGLRVHIVASGLALLIGPWQFARELRLRAPRVHRWSGRLYLVACAVGGLSGGALALFTTSSPVAGAGFLGLALGWLLTGFLGYRAVRAGDITRHRRWMTRSFALTYAAVMLRIYLPVSMVLGLELDRVYPAVAWLCWVPNLVVAQLLIDRAAARPSPEVPAQH
ncbi:hypothetical protein GCM10022204_35330 [Microlunatus aurantiacus]|uniref:DUF2306 domain-containing protein n=1 Tax=Microlunatus aurantiacus TaxID=446786 RepID=A0ABP7E481_9ACTN